MENLKVYNKKGNVVIRKIKVGLAIAAMSIAGLTACVDKNNTPTPTKPIEVTVDPTNDLTPTVEVTPTETPTPTPALTHKTLQEVKDELANVKVSIDDLMNEDVVYPTYFGAPDDSFTNEMLKRISYFESFGIMDFNTSKTLVTYLNYCYLNSDAVDKEKAESYLSLIDTDNAVQLIRILKSIIDYNIKNPDNQIVISWGATDAALGEDGRAVINSRQQQMTKAIMNKKSFNYIYISDKKYDITLNHKDGSTTKLTGEYDDLNIVVKIIASEISYSSLEYIVDVGFYSEYPSSETIDRFDKPASSIYRAVRDPEHANVRRHGFDANAYYEEDLDKISSINELKKVI
ncbi:MAG: hypothetical protein J6W64_02130 [Bacilli bacterium]|nr:hypothetical protein [Bacilli bacterium]